MPTRAVWETKRLLDVAQTATLEQQLENEARAQGELVKTDDFTEGVAAFVETARAGLHRGGAERFHPVQLVVHDDLRRWRLTVLLRWLLVIPHLIVRDRVALPRRSRDRRDVGADARSAGRRRPGFTPGSPGSLRYFTHVQAYAWLVADPFPSFRGWYGTYPVDLDIAPPARQARWSTAFRLVLALPAYVLAVRARRRAARWSRSSAGSRRSRSGACREECAT